ncbi:MAG: protein kinase [Myxococcota bacterium]
MGIEIDPYKPTVVESPPQAPGRSYDADGIELDRLRAATRAKLFGGEATPTTIGRYRIIKQLGAGGMGVVYLAHDDDLDRRVAVKILRANDQEGSEGQSRLVREARAMAKLSHPNVVHVYEVQRQDELVFIAMEHIAGENLRQWSTRSRPLPEVLAVHRQAGRGLAAAHAAGLVHRDYKPENVLVGQSGRVRVLDFGLARPDGSSAGSDPHTSPTVNDPRDWENLTATGTLLGTPAYMAPEQLRGRVADPRSDQFAFCVTLFESLYGERPFVGRTLADLSAAVLRGEVRSVDPEDHEVPAEVHRALLRGLSTRPDDRHPSMEALLNALEVAPPGGTSRRWWIPATLLGVGMAVGLALLGPQSAPTSEDHGEPAAVAPDPHAEILAASDLPEPLPEPIPDDPYQVTIHRLPNGLTVYIAPDHDAPLLSAAIVVRAGSIYAPPGSSGAAHMLQHMMIKGTARLGALDYSTEAPLLEQRNAAARELESTQDPERRRELVQQIERLAREAAETVAPAEYVSVINSIGGHLGVVHVDDLTSMFRVDIPSARLETWAVLEAERTRHPVFRGFFGELGMISEEFRMALGTFEEIVDMLQEELLAPTPYAYLTRGTLDSLARPLFSATIEFHRQRYLPNNMAVVLAGDVEAGTALPILERAFGDWPSGPVTTRPAFPPSLPPGRQELVVPQPDRWPLTLGWRIADDTAQGLSRIEYALAVIEHEVDAALAEAGLAASTMLVSHRFMIIASISASPQTSVDAVESAFFDALRAIRRDGPRAETLATVQARLTRSSIDMQRSTSQLASRIAESYGYGWSWVETVRSMHAPLDSAMIEQTLDHLLGTGFIATRRGDQPKDVERPSIPKIDKVDYSPNKSSEYARELLAIPAASIEPQFVVDGRHYHTSTFDRGIEIATNVDDGLTELELVYPVGTLEDPWVCSAIDLWLESGIESRTHQQLYDEWSTPGVSIDGWCGPTHSGISATVLDEHLDEAWPSLAQWLGHPRPRPRDLERARQRSLARHRDALGSTPSALEALQSYAVYGPRSRFHLGPEPASLTATTLARLSKTLDALRAQRPFILYAGSSRRPSMSALPPSMAQPATAVHVPPRAEPQLVALDDETIDRVRMSIVLTRGPLAPQEQILADLLQSYLSQGLNGLLDYELRLSLALVFSLQTSFTAPSSPLDDAQFRITLIVAPDQVPRVIDVVRSSMHRAIDPERFRAALDRLEARYRARRIPPPWMPREVFRWHQAGLDSDPLMTKWAALPRVTPVQLDAFKDSLLVDAPIIVILGDLDRIGRPALERLGALEEVTRDDIFGASSPPPPSPSGAP